MSNYQGNIIIKNPATPTGPAENGAAPGVWKLSDALGFIRQGIWPTQGVPAADPNFKYVSLLLSTTSLSNANNNLFVDSSGTFTPLSRTGNATQGSATPYSANWSNYFDGSSTLSFSSISLAGDFTIEAWVYYTSTSGNPTLLGENPPNNQSLRRLSGKHYFYRQGASITGTIDIPTNQWVHLAATRSGSTVRIFTNGVLDASGSISGTFSVNCFGGADTGTDRITGYASNVRVVNGTALYTATFTPPTSALTAVSGTVLLTAQSNRFRDASASPYTLTVNGSPRVTDFAPFSPSAAIAYNQSDITNWSGYFDGSGDYLTAPSDVAFGMGTGDFTIECWVNPSAYTGTGNVLIDMRSGSEPSIRPDLEYNSSGTLIYRVNGSTVITGSTLPLNTWSHVAVARSGTTTKMFLNGTQVGSSYTDSNNYGSSTSCRIGADDDGSPNAYVNGYMSNVRIVKGTAVYTGNFTPPTTNLTAISGTSLLTLQNAAFTDNSTNNFIVTPNGNVTVTGNSPFNTVGYWSNYFDGTSDWVATPSNAAFAFGTGDYTIECWMYPTSTKTDMRLWEFSGNQDNVDVNLSGNVGAISYYNGTISTASSAGVVNLNAWNHVACVRSSGTVRVYLNGILRVTQSVTPNTSDRILYVGGFGNNWFQGYISNFRVVKGTAVYTSAFTPPTAPLTAISGTSLLTCQNGRFIDNSTNAFTLTVNGNTSIQSFDPFYTSTIASNGGSIYFDGSGDNVSFLSGDKVQFGTGDFTVEFWVYPQNAASTSYYFVDGRNTGQTGTWAFYRNGSNQIEWYNGTSGFTATNVVANAWNHVVYCRSGTTGRTFLNGAVVGTFTDSTNYSLAPTRSYIGSMYTGNEVLNGYMSGLRITKSALYTAAFTPPTTPATPSASTLLLVNGMNAGIYDATAINDLETVGNAQVRYPSPFAPADYYAGSFDGAGDYLTVPYSTALQLPGDFTIEAWVYLNSRVTSFPCIVANYSTYATNGGFALFAGHNFNTTKYTVSFNGSFPVLTSSSSIVYGAWTHLAVVRSGSTLTLYVNGVSEATATNSATVTGTGDNWWIATSGDSTTSSYINGSISNLRVVKGTAVYTSNFTPSTTPLTAISGTSLLTCQNKTFIDNSTNAIAITSYGNATAGAIGPFTATGGTSVYFDGSGDYLSTPDSPNFDFGAGNFTIEAWVSFAVSTSGADYPIVVQGTNAFTSNASFAFTRHNSNKLRFIFTDDGTGGSGYKIVDSTNNFLPSVGVWYHLAVTRSGTTFRLFIDGVQAGSNTYSQAIYNGTRPITIGADDGASVALNGYIDDLRITKGYARYTANFTPPTAPFPTY